MTDSNRAFKVSANEFVFSFDKADVDAFDIVKKSNAEFNLIYNHRSISSKFIESDSVCKKLKIEVEGEIFEVEIKDELDQVLDKMGFGAISGKQIKEIKAPMPGLVLEISISDGQEVKKGDKILILEAMKMENSIVIHADAKIKRIAVSTGQAVEKGQILVELE
jgi:biotin carboxyl carrier protein